MLQTHLHRFDRRIGVRIGMVLIGAICAVAILAAQATAATTLHFYDQQLSSAFTDPSGRPIGNSTTPPPRISHQHHSDRLCRGLQALRHTPPASIHVGCVVTTAQGALLRPVRIGGSMLLANQFTVNHCRLRQPFLDYPAQRWHRQVRPRPRHRPQHSPPSHSSDTRSSPSPTPPDQPQARARHQPLPAARSQTVCGAVAGVDL